MIDVHNYGMNTVILTVQIGRTDIAKVNSPFLLIEKFFTALCGPSLGQVSGQFFMITV